jgi:6-phosphogluconate dehydrogenase
MGSNLLLNIASKGHTVAGFDVDSAKVEGLRGRSEGMQIRAYQDPAAFAAALAPPRPMLLLVPAGRIVDEAIESLLPHLSPGDFVIDGGNSHYKDTARRASTLEANGYGFLGLGVSGGERGARLGPAMMAGGTPENYARVQAVLESAAAKFEGEPCVALVGAGPAGHYVKMVHNGIEYAMMQSIAEVYDVLRRVLGHSLQDAANVFDRWTSSPLGGFLIEITASILAYRNPDDPDPLVELVLDKAKAKGTGKWTTQDAMDLGVPIPTIDASVSARQLSESRETRMKLATLIATPGSAVKPSLGAEELGLALEAAFWCAYIQGLSLIQAASHEYGFGTDLRKVTRIWRAGCIVRSRLLVPLAEASDRVSNRDHLLTDPALAARVTTLLPHLRTAVAASAEAGIPVPCLGASLSYLDGYRTARLPANIIQAQRDLFGAHGFERTDRPGVHHSDWGQP